MKKRKTVLINSKLDNYGCYSLRAILRENIDMMESIKMNTYYFGYIHIRNMKKVINNNSNFNEVY